MSFLCRNGHLVKHAHDADTFCSQCRRNNLRREVSATNKALKISVKTLATTSNEHLDSVLSKTVVKAARQRNLP